MNKLQKRIIFGCTSLLLLGVAVFLRLFVYVRATDAPVWARIFVAASFGLSLVNALTPWPKSAD